MVESRANTFTNSGPLDNGGLSSEHASPSSLISPQLAPTHLKNIQLFCSMADSSSAVAGGGGGSGAESYDDVEEFLWVGFFFGGFFWVILEWGF